MQEWSDWFSFECPDDITDIVPKRPGIYQVRHVKDKVAQPVQRFNGQDDQGLLYIGQTTNLRRRLREFMKSACSGTAGHSAGRTFHMYYAVRLKPDDLEFSWLAVSIGKAKTLERKLLDRYQKRYLDRPPLNISLMRK